MTNGGARNENASRTSSATKARVTTAQTSSGAVWSRDVARRQRAAPAGGASTTAGRSTAIRAGYQMPSSTLASSLAIVRGSQRGVQTRFMLTSWICENVVVKTAWAWA